MKKLTMEKELKSKSESDKKITNQFFESFDENDVREFEEFLRQKAKNETGGSWNNIAHISHCFWFIANFPYYSEILILS